MGQACGGHGTSTENMSQDLVEKDDNLRGEKDLEVRVATGAPPEADEDDWDPSEGQGASSMTQAGRDQLEEMTEKTRMGARAQDLDAEDGLFYPMYGIPFNKFVGLGHIPRNDEAVKEDLLVRFDPEKHQAVFISQDWWTRSGVCAPDLSTGMCKDLKFRVICRGVNALQKGEAWAFGGSSVEPFDPNKEVILWMDWFSLDLGERSKLLLGARTLPYYISKSKYMLVPTREQKLEARYPDKIPGYGHRAWCRLESMIMSVTTEMEKEGQLVQLFAADINGALRQYPHVKISGGRYDEMPERGLLTVEEDREIIQSLQSEVLSSFGQILINKACKGAPMAINLGGKLLCSAHMRTLVEGLAKTSVENLRVISLNNNVIGDSGLQTLLDFLKQEKGFTDSVCLDLACNSLSDKGLQLIATSATDGSLNHLKSFKIKLSFNTETTQGGALNVLGACNGTVVQADFSGHVRGKKPHRNAKAS